MEFARVYFAKPFDLVVSGINMGINAGASIISSGTFGAAFKAASLGVAPFIIALSWDRAFHELYNNHTGKEAIEHFHEYPGEAAGKLIRRALREKFWGAKILNINLPAAATNAVRFTKLLTDIDGFWPPVVIRRKDRIFWYGAGLPNRPAKVLTLDADVLARNMISITPCHPDMTNHTALRFVRKAGFSL
jgi:5'/3'-nucleotidase SurE